MTQEKASKLNAALLSIVCVLLAGIITMLGWIMSDFSSFKTDISTKIETYSNKITDHFIQAVIKNAEQDAEIMKNHGLIENISTDVKEVKDNVKKNTELLNKIGGI